MPLCVPPPRRQRMDWLDAKVSEDGLLRPLPARSFDVSELTAGAAEALLPVRHQSGR
jgi:hypothetical protein